MKKLSPQCRSEVHASCVWFEVSADFRRVYWCECECHDGGTVIDLTEVTPGVLVDD